MQGVDDMRYALIHDGTKVVINVIEWDGETPWAPPEGHSIVKSHTASPGDTYANRKFVRPAVPTEPTEREQMQADYAAATPAGQRAMLAKHLGFIEE